MCQIQFDRKVVLFDEVCHLEDSSHGEGLVLDELVQRLEEQVVRLKVNSTQTHALRIEV